MRQTHPGACARIAVESDTTFWERQYPHAYLPTLPSSSAWTAHTTMPWLLNPFRFRGFPKTKGGVMVIAKKRKIAHKTRPHKNNVQDEETQQ